LADSSEGLVASSLVSASRRGPETDRLRESASSPRARGGPFIRRNHSVRQRRSRDTRKNLHRTCISHAVFLARNLRPHYSAFISELGWPPLARLFFYFPSRSISFFFFFFFLLLLSFSFILICFARPRGARDGIYLAARADLLQSFGRRLRSPTDNHRGRL